MSLPIIDPNECMADAVAAIRTFLTTGQVPDGGQSIGHLLTIAGALTHQHGLGAANEGPELQELAEALGCEPCAASEAGGPLVNLLLPVVIDKLAPILIAMIQKWLESR